MNRTIITVAIGMAMFCAALGFKYRQVVEQKVMKYYSNLSTVRQANAIHIEEGSCIATNYRLDLPQKRLSQLSAITGLKHISSGESFYIGSLAQSKPLLTKRGQIILNIVANDFQRRLDDKGYKKKKIVITSMTRSVNSLKQIQENTKEADITAHIYGSTFDISLQKFNPVERSPGEEPSQEILVQTLDETVVHLKRRGELVGMKNVEQNYYHITASCAH